ncbi:MAG: hypothetical protein IPH58_01720 [Sphingobacteriales bacterium]|nr:hypothetical protein [Sphingobacteriales bacterium]
MKYFPNVRYLTMITVVFLMWIFAFKPTIAQAVNDTSGIHELTVFIIDPAVSINWQSPSKLYSSIKKSFFRKVFHPQMRFLGHMAFCLNSDLLDEPLWMGIAPWTMAAAQSVINKKSRSWCAGYSVQSKDRRKAITKTIN